MPTFNQLVRKGREEKTSKSNSPALGKRFNSMKMEKWSTLGMYI